MKHYHSQEVKEMKVFMPEEDNYDDGDIPEVDTEPYENGFYIEPLPESERPRRDGPGGN
jgi:hypothetical protein